MRVAFLMFESLIVGITISRENAEVFVCYILVFISLHEIDYCTLSFSMCL